MAAAPTNNNYSSMIDAVTTQQFMRGAFNNTKQRVLILKELDAKGNIKPDAGGKFLERNARVGEYVANYRADLAIRDFQRKQLYVTYAIPYSDMEVLGVLSENDVKYQTSKETLVRLQSNIMKDMGDDFYRRIGKELMQTNGATVSAFNGTAAVAASTPVPFFGLPTIFATGALASTNGYNPDTGLTTGVQVAATDKEATPNTTYCGITTNPGTAIAGVDNKVAEATSPVIANWSSTAWNSTASTTWATNCVDVVDHMLNRLTRTQDPTESPDFGFLTRTMFTQFTAAVRSNNRVLFQNNIGIEPNARLYTDNVIPYGNLKIFWDIYALTGVFYMLNSNKMEFDYFPARKIIKDDTLEGMPGGNEMSEVFGVRTQYDISSGAHLAVATIGAQLWANARFQGAAFNYA